VRERRYWDWSVPSQQQRSRASFDDAAEELRNVLVDAVRLQLRADVPVGAYLSGGLDSSVLVALIKNYTNSKLRTFSVAFEDAEFDESTHQQSLVKFLGTDHTALRCSRSAIGEHFPELIKHVETPLVRTAPVPLMLLSRLVKQSGYKVVLTGEGADEVFAGYDVFKEAKIRRFLARQPHSQWRATLLRRLYPYLRNSPVATPAFAKSFFSQGEQYLNRSIFAHVPRWTTSRRALQFFAPEVRAIIDRGEPFAQVEEALPKQLMEWSTLARDQYVEVKTLLSSYLLSSQGDRVAMANSVEGRVPFLDHRVIEFANTLPDSYKLRGLREKIILRRAFRGLLPDELLQRPKQPYRAPDSQCFFLGEEPLDFVADLLSADRIRAAGYFDAAPVGRLLDKCRTGRVLGFSDNQAFVGIVSTMLLDEFFVRRAQ
jgi:asparagine synthase (glutamine-hydrolysing)